MKHVFLILALLLVLSACATGDNQNGETVPESPSSARDLIGDTDWVLISGSVDGSAAVLVDGAPVTLKLSADGISGRSACNSYGAQLNEDGGPLFADMFSTMMACADPGVNELEVLATQGLSRVTDVAIDNDELVLTAEGVALRFVPVEQQAPLALEGTRWELDTIIQGDTASTPVAAAELLLQDGQLIGNSGCNRFGSPFEIDGGTLIVRGIEAEEQGCSDAIMRQEGLMYEILGGQPAWSIEGRTLTLTSGENGLIYRSP